MDGWVLGYLCRSVGNGLLRSGWTQLICHLTRIEADVGNLVNKLLAGTVVGRRLLCDLVIRAMYLADVGDPPDIYLILFECISKITTILPRFLRASSTV